MPSPPDRRARARARRLDEIIDEAMVIVRTEGIDALTTHRLADRLELAVGALYRYFPSKAHLVAALERQAIASLHAHLKAAIAALPDARRDPDASLARLVALGRSLRSFARLHLAEFALISQLLADPRTLVPGAEGASLLATAMGLLAEVAAHLDDAVALGALGPGHGIERAVLFWSGLRGVIELHKLRAHTDALDVDALVDAMTRTLLAGWGADPRSLDRALAHNTTETRR